MKYLLTAMLLLFVCIVSAQIVNIPDPLFKQQLLDYIPAIDINQDHEIEVNEALAVTDLQIYAYQVTDMTGIRSFTNLQTLSISSPTVLSLDLSGLSMLTDLEMNVNALNSINLTNCTAIKNLKISGQVHLPMLDINTCINLEKLDLEAVSIASHLDLSNCPKLEYFASEGDLAIPSINLTNSTKLKYFDCTGTQQLTSIDLSHSPKLEGIRCMGNALLNEFILGTMDSLNALQCEVNYYLSGDFDLSHYKNLTQYFGDGNHFRSLNFSGLNKLTLLRCSSNDSLAMINLNGCSSLTSVNFGENVNNVNFTGCTGLLTLSAAAKFKTLDLSPCINLKTLYLSSYDTLNLNLKNGSMLNNFSFHLYAPINICADNFEIDTLQHFLNNSNFPGNVSSYCSFFPGGNYNTITGKIKVDINNNGCDSNDPGVTQIPILFTEPGNQTTIRYTYTDGEYANYVYTGNFTLSPYFAYPYFSIAPLSANVNFDTANNIISTNNFCVTPIGVHNDLEITFLPLSAARPGFNTQYRLVFKNRGTNTASGNVQVNFDNSKMNFISATTTVNSQSAGQLSWNYNGLFPFQSRSIDVTFNLLPPPVNNIGDTLTFLATIDPVAGDETPDDNIFILPQGVRASMDPNVKECLEGSRIDIASLNTALHYIVHFQNTGNDTAFNVVVVDTLSNNVDWNSVELIGSSHPCKVSQKNGVLEFFFENIKLPYKAINEPASNGFVSYKVRPKNTLLLSDSVKNSAAIYFDFNPPVITNTTVSVVSPSVQTPVILEYFSLNNNSSGNVLTWKVRSTVGYTIFEIERSDDGLHFTGIGDITATVDRCLSPFNFTDDHPVFGKNYYRIKITGADGRSFYSEVLTIGKNNSGIDLSAIVSDQNNTLLYLNVFDEQTVQMNVIAADGRLIYSQNKIIAAGHSQINLPLKNISKGVYTLIFYTNAGEVITKRFVK